MDRRLMASCFLKPAFVFGLFVLTNPLMALAQSWELRTFDDGSFFFGIISQGNGPGPSLSCGERSPQGVSPRITGNMEPEITPPRSLRLSLSPNDIGPPNDYEPTRSDVMIVSGTLGYRLPVVSFNELTGAWETDLAADDPVFAAMGATPWIDLHSRIGQRRVIADGFSTAYGQLNSYCQSMFATIGMPWHAAGGTALTMRDAAETAIAIGCNGPALRDPEYLLSANIDGDGQEDVVLDWSRVQCSTGPARPFCGASLCSAEVFLSATYPRTGEPENILALGVRIVALNNGNDGVVMGGNLASCAPPNQRSPCEFMYYWNGVALVAAP